MYYICVRTYGNGHWQNKIFPMLYKSIESAEKKCEELNNTDIEEHSGEKWVPFTLYKED